jgi:hypothetical protein
MCGLSGLLLTFLHHVEVGNCTGANCQSEKNDDEEERPDWESSVYFLGRKLAEFALETCSTNALSILADALVLATASAKRALLVDECDV